MDRKQNAANIVAEFVNIETSKVAYSKSAEFLGIQRRGDSIRAATVMEREAFF